MIFTCPYHVKSVNFDQLLKYQEQRFLVVSFASTLPTRIVEEVNASLITLCNKKTSLCLDLLDLVQLGMSQLLIMKLPLKAVERLREPLPLERQRLPDRIKVSKLTIERGETVR